MSFSRVNIFVQNGAKARWRPNMVTGLVGYSGNIRRKWFVIVCLFGYRNTEENCLHYLRNRRDPVQENCLLYLRNRRDPVQENCLLYLRNRRDPVHDVNNYFIQLLLLFVKEATKGHIFALKQLNLNPSTLYCIG